MFMVKRGKKWYVLLDMCEDEVCVTELFEYADPKGIFPLYMWWNLEYIDLIEYVG